MNVRLSFGWRAPFCLSNPSKTSGPVLIRVERGDPGVSIASYATVLFVLGMADRLGDLVDPKSDPVGMQLEEDNLPQRIRGGRRPKHTKEE